MINQRLIMDDLDRKLITLLRQDARRSISDLALDLKISRATVRARIDRLEKAGDVVGYTVILRADAIDQSIRGIMMVSIEGAAKDKIVRALGGYPQVSAIHTTNGRWDIVVEISAGSLSEFDDVLHHIRLLPGVSGSETSLLLSTPRTTKARI